MPEPAEKMKSRLEIIDALLKGRFASRSEAARYAAEQRWKGHVKDERGDRVARLKAMLTPEIVSRLMAAGEAFDARGGAARRMANSEEYLADSAGASLVTVLSIPSTGQWDERTQTFRPANGEMLQVQLPNRRAMEIDDQVNAVGVLAHEIVMDRLDASMAEALRDLPRLESEAKELATLAMERRTLIRQEFGVRPESNAKNAKWGMAQWYNPTELKAVGGSFPDPPNGASPKYRVAADDAKASLDSWEAAHEASVKADESLASWMKAMGLEGRSTFYLRTRIELGESEGLSESDQREFMRLSDESQAANKVRLNAVNTFRDNAIKAAKLYEKEAFGETVGETNKRSLAAQEALAKAHATSDSSYGREFVKLAEELGVKMFDGKLSGQEAFTRIKASDFVESLKVLPQEYVERPFSKYKIEVRRQSRGGSWNSFSFGGKRPQVIRTDGSQGTNIHEVTHAAADAIPFVSMIQRTMNARRMMGTRVAAIEDYREPPREGDPPEVEGRIRQRPTTFFRRPLETVVREGVERYYSGTYSYGNRFVRDQFTDSYAGRVYDDDARETMTRGIEYLFGRDHKGGVPKDVDHVASVMGTLLVVGLSRGQA